MNAAAARKNFINSMNDEAQQVISKIDSMLQQQSKISLSMRITLQELNLTGYIYSKDELINSIIIPYYKGLGFKVDYGTGSYGGGPYLWLEW